jgi:hypothetical protein
MGVKLVSASGGSVEINPPATASNFVATMPAGTGNVVVNGVNGALVAATAQASTSGTSIDFTGIPSWVRRITVMFNGVSTNGSSALLVQLGAGSVTTSGYVSTSNGTNQASATGGVSATSGLIIRNASAASSANSGHMTITNISGNTWVASHTLKNATTEAMWGGGDVTLGGTLDRVRITTVNGTDTFDAGSINILYE